MKKTFILMMLLTGLFACKKTVSDFTPKVTPEVIVTDQEVNGVIKDFTGRLDGCTILIVLPGGKKLEIHSVPPGTVLVDGKSVAIKYTMATGGYATACMAGDVVDITSLRYL